MQAFRLLTSAEGIIPAIQGAHALAGALDVGTELGPDGLILVNLPGRGDKDMDTAARYFGQHEDAATVEGPRSEREHPAASRHPGPGEAENRAALIAGLPAGFPAVDGGIAAIQAA